MHTLKTVVIAIVLGLVYFGIVMGVAMGLVSFNANATPTWVWFPIPNTVLIIIATAYAQKRLGIGLVPTKPVTRNRMYLIGGALTILGMAACAVQGKFSGYVRATELLDYDVSALFQISYALYMPVFAAVLAEVTFRGVMQTRMQRVLGVWPLVITIAVVNVFAHRWGPEITQNGIGLFVILAGWTYLRWLSGSLWPPLILHAVLNFIMAIGLWTRGPLVHAEASTSVITSVGVMGLLALALSVMLVRGWEFGKK
ncbi:MAG: CPBP family intramembrane glutamic endopeptidase [Gammaproteobacteria bacterium]